MRLTIFTRLVIGYLVIFLLVIAMSFYAIVRIDKFNEITSSVLTTDNRIIDTAQKLSDNLLSQVLSEKKFVITKDGAFYQQFQRLRNDFSQYMEQLTVMGEAPQVKQSLGKIAESYQQYAGLFEEEVTYLRSNLVYLPSRFQQEREKISNLILEDLDRIKFQTQQNTNQKIQTLYEAGINARRMAILLTVAFLVIGITTTLLINHSITQPISILKKKTGEIAKGVFKGDLRVASPPEIGELSSAFNLMCAKLSELDRMKSDFFSSMSHELRTPLSTIKMGVGLLREGVEGPITEKQMKLLDILQTETNRLIVLVNALLDLSKMEAGMMKYHLEIRPLLPLVERALAEMEPVIKARKIRLEKELSPDLPQPKIDGERILQVLRNLLGNAMKFTPEGGQVRVSTRPREEGVEVSVSDTGPGIAKENLATIFDKFQQGSYKGWVNTKGTGLGLAIAKQIITGHGGRIWAESEPGNGSRFIFVLPA